jgi:uncharacterized protein (TIGR02266 family)
MSSMKIAQGLRVRFKGETLADFAQRHLTDISPRGIFIRTAKPLEVGTEVQFEFLMENDAPLLSGTGVVIWVSDENERLGIPSGMEIQIRTMTEESQARFEWLQLRRRGAHVGREDVGPDSDPNLATPSVKKSIGSAEPSPETIPRPVQGAGRRDLESASVLGQKTSARPEVLAQERGSLGPTQSSPESLFHQVDLGTSLPEISSPDGRPLAARIRPAWTGQHILIGALGSCALLIAFGIAFLYKPTPQVVVKERVVIRKEIVPASKPAPRAPLAAPSSCVPGPNRVCTGLQEKRSPQAAPRGGPRGKASVEPGPARPVAAAASNKESSPSPEEHPEPIASPSEEKAPAASPAETKTPAHPPADEKSPAATKESSGSSEAGKGSASPPAQPNGAKPEKSDASRRIRMPSWMEKKRLPSWMEKP